MPLSYSLDAVQQSLQDFYTVTGLRIALFDERFREIFAHPSRLSDFCKLLRGDRSLNQACQLCDYSMFVRCKESKQIIIDQCHLGLTEIMVPIVSSDLIVGYLMCGQIHTVEAKCFFREDFLLYAHEYKLPVAQLCAAHAAQSPIPEENLAAIVRLLQMLAGHLLHSHLLTLPQQSLGAEIDRYILEHITEQLDVATLCEAFHYQKTNFYKITNAIYGIGIMKHIRHMRMQCAKELLCTTRFSISQVAAMVGIEDYNYFTKVFRQEANCTPSEYRRNNLLFAPK